ncbi:MAG: hypothetical protein R2769_02495 [Saprospiraceae bacterium]
MANPDDQPLLHRMRHDTNGAAGPEFHANQSNNVHVYDEDGDNPDSVQMVDLVWFFDFPLKLDWWVL